MIRAPRYLGAAVLAASMAFGLEATTEAQGPFSAQIQAALRSVGISAGTGGGARIVACDGTAAAPCYSFASDPDTGLFTPGAGFIQAGINGANSTLLGAVGVYLGSTQTLRWASGTNPFNDPTDLILTRDAANTLAQRNGTNAQAWRIYDTYTDASNYVRTAFSWGASTFTITTEAGGTGVLRNLKIGGASTTIRTNNTDRWDFTSAGHMTAAIDNTYDIGASGATRPRNLFLGNVGSALRWDATNSTVGFSYLSTGAALSSSTTTGTLVTQDAQTVANAATHFLGAASSGFIDVATDDGFYARYVLRSTVNSTVEVTDIGGVFTAVKDTVTSFNIYYDAAGGSGAGYYLQNNRGASRTIRVIRLGT